MISTSTPVCDIADHHRSIPCAYLLLLLPLFAACNKAADGPMSSETSQVRHMMSYSLIEHLDEAELQSAQKTTIEARVVTAGGVERPAIFAHAPSTIRFKAIPILPDTSLHFGIGLADGPRKKKADGVRFVVQVEDEAGSASEVFARVINPHKHPQERRWTDVEVALGDFADRTVDLVFITDQRRTWNVDTSAWSFPILRSTGSQIDLSDFKIKKWNVLQDLHASRRTQRFQITPAKGASLELAGEIELRGARTKPPLEPVDFAATIDGQSIFSKALRVSSRRVGFAESIPLDRFAERTVELSLEIKHRDVSSKRSVSARWLRTTVVQAEELPRSHASDGPNLLILLVDTLRADHLGLYGYERDTTPNLDRFAADSLVFTKAISQSSWTMPATASLLTGLSPLDHGVTDGQALAFEFETVAERLQEAGLTTFGLSANPIVGREEGFHQGFERFIHLPWLRADQVNELFSAFLEEHQDLRWFAYLHYIDPHDPYDAPESTKGVFTKDYKGPFSRRRQFNKLVESINFGWGEKPYTDRDIEYLRSAYDEEILFWDMEFGRLFEAMRQLGVLENTIIIVTSDHGEEFLDHGKLKHGLQLYNELIRVPLLIRAPGLVSPGRRKQPVETRNLIQAALGVMVPEGGSVGSKGLLAERPGRQIPAFSHTNHALLPDQKGRTTLVSVQDDEWKYITFVDHGRFELYNLQEDPSETVNYAQQRPEVSSRYQKLLERWFAQSRPTPTGASDASPETVEKLRALGYIQ